MIAVLALATVAYAQKPIALIVRQAQDISPEGAYNYYYETENGISVDEFGAPKVPGPEDLAIAAQGTFKYTTPDGTPISVSYIADENGFQPQDAHLPVAPPTPEAIQRSLTFITAHPQPQAGGNQILQKPFGQKRFF